MTWTCHIIMQLIMKELLLIKMNAIQGPMSDESTFALRVKVCYQGSSRTTRRRSTGPENVFSCQKDSRLSDTV